MTQIIDCHCHLGSGHDYQQSITKQLKEMDYFNIDKAVICTVDKFLAVDNKKGNDFILKAARQFPNRFIPFATANPWYGKKAIVELKRSINEGARGIKLHPSIQGFLLCDDLVYPIIELACEYKLPIYFHTGTPAYSQPMHVAELALRFPEANLIMGHMGSTDFWIDAVPAAQLSSNIYVDTSWSLPDKIRHAIDILGVNRVLFGSDSPLSSYTVEMGCINATSLDENEKVMLFSKNFLRLIGELS